MLPVTRRPSFLRARWYPHRANTRIDRFASAVHPHAKHRNIARLFSPQAALPSLPIRDPESESGESSRAHALVDKGAACVRSRRRAGEAVPVPPSLSCARDAKGASGSVSGRSGGGGARLVSAFLSSLALSYVDALRCRSRCAGCHGFADVSVNTTGHAARAPDPGCRPTHREQRRAEEEEGETAEGSPAPISISIPRRVGGRRAGSAGSMRSPLLPLHPAHPQSLPVPRAPAASSTLSTHGSSPRPLLVGSSSNWRRSNSPSTLSLIPHHSGSRLIRLSSRRQDTFHEYGRADPPPAPAAPARVVLFRAARPSRRDRDGGGVVQTLQRACCPKCRVGSRSGGSWHGSCEARARPSVRLRLRLRAPQTLLRRPRSSPPRLALSSPSHLPAVMVLVPRPSLIPRILCSAFCAFPRLSPLPVSLVPFLAFWALSIRTHLRLIRRIRRSACSVRRSRVLRPSPAFLVPNFSFPNTPHLSFPKAPRLPHPGSHSARMCRSRSRRTHAR
ncbi:hypothetical protein B0H11DRAFT_2145888 [Mycena galericulata]|nr:hypothetical protein B0H11DRAFT_2145888 [Mycena galericulata]